MNERIKKLRKALDLTQQEFGNRIGIKRNTLANYEIGRNEPIDAVINLICREFNVSETWLRTGKGEMFVEAPSDVLDALAKEYGLDRFGRAVIEKMVNLDEKQWELLSKMVTGIVSSLSEDAAPALSETTASVPDTSGQERTEPGLAAKVAELERQNQELAAKVAAMEEEDALLEPMDTSEVSPLVSAGTFSPRIKN